MVIRRMSLRLFAFGVLVFTSCNKDPIRFACSTDEQCTLETREGKCVDKIDGRGVCALADPGCDSGFRYDESSGRTDCYVESVSTDMAAADLSSLVDLAPENQDFSNLDMRLGPLQFVEETNPLASSSFIPLSIWASADGSSVWISGTKKGSGMGVVGTTLWTSGSGNWSEQISGLPTTDDQFRPGSVWGPEPSLVFVAGSNLDNTNFLYKNPGIFTWSAITPSGIDWSTAGVPVSIDGLSPTDIFIATNMRKVVRLIGTTWRTETGCTETGIASLANVSVTTNAALIGYRQSGAPCFSIGNGTWSSQSAPSPPGTANPFLEAVYAESATRLYAIGNAYNPAIGESVRYLISSDGGGQWSMDTKPATFIPIGGGRSFATVENNVWVIGFNGFYGVSSTRGSWTADQLRLSNGTTITKTLALIASVKTPRQVYIIAADGSIYHGR
jgi:hypothetical protein